MDKILTRGRDGAYRLHVSVPQDRAQDVADALRTLMVIRLGDSRSSIVCDAIVAYSKQKGDKRDDEAETLYAGAIG